MIVTAGKGERYIFTGKAQDFVRCDLYDATLRSLHRGLNGCNFELQLLVFKSCLLDLAELYGEPDHICQRSCDGKDNEPERLRIQLKALTFDMSDMPRVAGAYPLDGRVGRHEQSSHSQVSRPN